MCAVVRRCGQGPRSSGRAELRAPASPRTMVASALARVRIRAAPSRPSPRTCPSEVDESLTARRASLPGIGSIPPAGSGTIASIPAARPSKRAPWRTSKSAADIRPRIVPLGRSPASMGSADSSEAGRSPISCGARGAACRLDAARRAVRPSGATQRSVRGSTAGRAGRAGTAARSISARRPSSLDLSGCDRR